MKTIARDPSLLDVQGLSAGYGEAVVVQDVSFTLARGESLALLGRNGTPAASASRART